MGSPSRREEKEEEEEDQEDRTSTPQRLPDPLQHHVWREESKTVIWYSETSANGKC